MALTFGPFALDPDRRTLTRDGHATELGQRGMALLQALVAADGEAASRQSHATVFNGI